MNKNADIETMELIDNLNHSSIKIRLSSLKQLVKKIEAGEIDRPHTGDDVNNHIHTTYSFSPYSPTKAIWMAYVAGLSTAGIMDHDSISGAEEFIEAGKIVGIATTIGVECRVSFLETPLAGKRINNPDQISVAYMALHGIPHTQIYKVKGFFQQYTTYRNLRNRLMIGKINNIFSKFDLSLSFEKDVIPVSKFQEGGSITERHILYALSLKLIEAFGKGERLVGFLKEQLRLDINKKIEDYLKDAENPYYAYDLLGLLKSGLVSDFYIDASLECPDVKDVIAFSSSIGTISAYAYLGDVGNSVTGDKKTQKFEDDYIELLFNVIKESGFNAVTYMPSRNSRDQLGTIRKHCEQHGFLQISGEDINSPRQSFICDAMKNGEFRNLYDAAWALIGHEIAATADLDNSMFSNAVINKYPDLTDRINIYKEIAKNG